MNKTRKLLLTAVICAVASSITLQVSPGGPFSELLTKIRTGINKYRKKNEEKKRIKEAMESNYFINSFNLIMDNFYQQIASYKNKREADLINFEEKIFNDIKGQISELTNSICTSNDTITRHTIYKAAIKKALGHIKSKLESAKAALKLLANIQSRTYNSTKNNDLEKEINLLKRITCNLEAHLKVIERKSQEDNSLNELNKIKSNVDEITNSVSDETIKKDIEATCENIKRKISKLTKNCPKTDLDAVYKDTITQMLTHIEKQLEEAKDRLSYHSEMQNCNFNNAYCKPGSERDQIFVGKEKNKIAFFEAIRNNLKKHLRAKEEEEWEKDNLNSQVVLCQQSTSIN